MKITGTLWFTGGNGTVGIVFGVDEVTRKKKAYIGSASGTNEENDAQSIAEHGARLYLYAAKEIVRMLS